MVTAVNIAGTAVGPRHPCFIIAEAGVNHDGDLDKGKQLIDIAVSAGANAVKFQTFKTESVISRISPKANYQIETTGSNESQFEMVKKLELAPEAFKELMEYCQKRDILFMSTPFDEESVEVLDGLDVSVFKIASGEITNFPLLYRIATTGKPLIISTGMSNLSDVEAALAVVNEAGNNQVILLHCVSNYPANPKDVNLHSMRTMESAFSVPVGYSDHTLGIEIPLAAVAMGACAIEKHFTLDSSMPGPDHRSSLEPTELESMVNGIRIVESALGSGQKKPAASEKNTASVARKSLVAAHNLRAGTVLTENMISIKRPGTGLPPAMRPYILGRTLKVDTSEDNLITLEMLN